jgi:hypothetical protein
LWSSRYLLWLVQSAIDAELPMGWEEVNQDGATYFLHRVLGLTSWDHPLDAYHRTILTRLREASLEKLSE